MSDDSVAVVQGNFLTHGGSERVAQQLATVFDAPLYCGFSRSELLEESESDAYHTLFDSFLANRVRGKPLFRDLYHLWNWPYRPELHEYDTVIISGNEPGWYVPTESQTVIRYVHSTPRTTYDQFHNRGDSRIVKLYGLANRVLYRHTLSYPDLFIANSEIIQRRIQRYWDKDATVVYPPVPTSSFYRNNDTDGDDYYVTVSRLESTKRVGEIVDAFKRLPEQQLRIAGSGPEEHRLKRTTADADNIEFLGYVSEEKKRDLLAHANGYVFNAVDEDFGIAVVEALAAGVPVAGVAEGYTQHQITDGETGVTYEHGVDNLVSAIRSLESDGVSQTPAEIQESAEKYATSRFRAQMKTLVREASQNAELAIDQ